MYDWCVWYDVLLNSLVRKHRISIKLLQKRCLSLLFKPILSIWDTPVFLEAGTGVSTLKCHWPTFPVIRSLHSVSYKTRHDFIVDSFLVVILCIPCGMMTSSNGIICRVTGPLCEEFTGHPSQRPVTRSFDVFSDLCLNSRLSKQSWGWWFETPWRPLGRHSNDLYDLVTYIRKGFVYGITNALDCAYELILMRRGQLSGNKIHKTPQSGNRVPISVNT